LLPVTAGFGDVHAVVHVPVWVRVTLCPATGLPPASVTVTETENALPAVAGVGEGVTTTALGAPTLTVKLGVVAETDPDVAVMVSVPALLTQQLLKVACPLAFVVPVRVQLPTVPEASLRVTAVPVATGLPN
jgi:hypothetical protein